MKSPTIKVSPTKFRALLKEGVSLDQLYLLLLIEEGYDIHPLDEPKERGLIQTLLRKGYINENNTLQEPGKKVIEFLNSKEGKGLKLAKLVNNEAFAMWWKAYPGTDTVIKDKKVIYKGSRSLKVNKDACEAKFCKILAEQEYTVEQLIAALNAEIDLKTERSIREHTNKMTYMQNSLTYLNQRTFEGFIELGQIKTENIASVGGIVGI